MTGNVRAVPCDYTVEDNTVAEVCYQCQAEGVCVDIRPLTRTYRVALGLCAACMIGTVRAVPSPGGVLVTAGTVQGYCRQPLRQENQLFLRRELWACAAVVAGLQLTAAESATSYSTANWFSA